MARFKPSRGLALAVVAFVAGTLGPEIAAGSPGPSASAYRAVNPTRVVDTRTGLGGTTLGAGAVLTVALAGAAGGVPDDANAVALNVTVANGSTTSFLTVWPAGLAQPDASSLNWSDGAPRANSVTSKLSTDGAISLFNERGTVDVIIDVVGYYQDTYVVEPESTSLYVADANGNHLGDVVSIAGGVYSVLGVDGYVYNYAGGTGALTVTSVWEVFLTGDCTGPSKWTNFYVQLAPQMLFGKNSDLGAGDPMFTPGAIDPAYPAQSSRSGASCGAYGGSPLVAIDLVAHGVIPAHPAPLTIQR